MRSQSRDYGTCDAVIDDQHLRSPEMHERNHLPEIIQGAISHYDLGQNYDLRREATIEKFSQ